MNRSAVLVIIVLLGLLSCQEGRSQSATEQKIRGLAVQQVLSFCSECNVAVETKWMAGKLSRVDTTKIQQLQFEEVGLPRGYQTARIVYTQDGYTQKQQVQLFISLQRKLPVVNTRIERGHTITSDDLAFKIRDITRMRELPIASKKKIVGQAAGSLIPKGSVILDSDLQKVPIVKAGDQVRMIYRKAGVEVALDCTARQARAKGEEIRVFSKETRKTYIAKVVTPSKVIWEKTL